MKPMNAPQAARDAPQFEPCKDTDSDGKRTTSDSDTNCGRRNQSKAITTKETTMCQKYKLSFVPEASAEFALSAIRVNLLALGADKIDTANTKLLVLRGLIEVAALSLRTSEAVDAFATEVKKVLSEKR